MDDEGGETSERGRPRTRHYQRIVGVSPSDVASNDRWYELLVTGHEELGALSTMTFVLARHRVNIAPSGGYYTLARKDFVWTTFVDFAGTQSSIDDVVKDIRGLGFVGEVEAVKLDAAAFDQFLFPVMISDRFRGVILSLEPLLRVEQKLTEQLGSAGGALMFQEGLQYMIENVKQLGEIMPKAHGGALLAAVISWLRTTGWGIYEFDVSKLGTEGKASVWVLNPSNAVVAGSVRSNFGNGAAAGVMEAVYGIRMHLTACEYDESEGLLRLEFETSSQVSGH